VGVHRDGGTLHQATEQLDFWLDVAQRLGGCDRTGRELRNMLLVAQLVAAGATHREESRGGHFRSDFPQGDTAPYHVLVSPCPDTEGRIGTLAMERVAASTCETQ